MASTYYELLALDIELEIIKETIVLQNNQLSIIKIEKEAGRANELAVKQFEGQLYNSQSLEIEVLQSITETENKLNFLMGRYPQPIQRDKLTFNRAIPTQILIGIPAELLKNRPDIRQAEYELIASRADVKAARAAFYPSLTITAGVGFQAFDTRYLFSPQSLAYNALGSLTAPLINQSAIKAQFRTAKAAQLQALYAYQRSILNGYVEVYNQMNNISNLEKIYTLKNNEVAVLSNGIETASELYLTGRATYLEIVITRKNALQSRLELIEIKRRQYNSVINIYKALGGGWE
jgi:outer membrane protein, multidrug efflux system